MFVLDPKKTALIIVDIQVDFCSPNGASAKYGGGIDDMGKIIPKLSTFQQDMKHAGVAIIFTRYISTKKNSPANIALLLSLSKIFPICVEGEKGAQIYKLKPSTEDLIIDKEYYDAFAGTPLLKELQKKGIQNVLFTGVWTDMCVDTTAKRAVAEGFNAIIIKDLVSTIDERMDRHKQVLKDFEKYFGFVKSSHEVLQLLKYKYL